MIQRPEQAVEHWVLCGLTGYHPWAGDHAEVHLCHSSSVAQHVVHLQKNKDDKPSYVAHLWTNLQATYY